MSQKFTVVVTDDGKIAFFAQNGSYVEGKENISAMLNAIAAQGIQVPAAVEVEQHRHDNPLTSRLHDLAHHHQPG